MTFEELSTKSVSYQEWYVKVGYLDAGRCRQRADDWCEQPVMPQVAAPALPVSEPSAVLMLACGLLAVAIRRKLTHARH